MNDGIKLFTTIKPNLLKYYLIKSTILSIFGISVLFLGGIFLPSYLLAYFGIPILLLGGALITWGMIPYKKINRLELKPNEILLTDSYFQYFESRKPIISIPIQQISEYDFFENDIDYGVKVYILNEHGIIYHTKKLHLNRDNKGEYFIFPYFPLRAFTRLKL